MKLEPTTQFVPTPEKVRHVVARYGLFLTHYEPATSGIENLTLIVRAGNTKYVLRIYRQGKKSDGAIYRELDFMAALRNGGLPVPRVVTSLGSDPLVISHFEGLRWQSLLFEYAPGQHPETYTLALVEEMARLQAQMHLIGETYARSHHITNESHHLKETEVTPLLLQDESTDSIFRPFLTWLDSFTVELDASLPTGLSHFDYDAENLFANAQDQVTAILDFDDAHCGPLVVCLGYTLCEILTHEPQLAPPYLRKYQEIRPLTQSEKEALPQIIRFRYAMLTAFDIHFGALDDSQFERAMEQNEEFRDLELSF